MAGVIQGRVLVAGAVEGAALASTEPLSFWGGYDQTSGEIIDRRHPLSGCIAVDKILALPASRGSSTTAAVLLEAVRRGTAPAAIITDGTDTFLTLAAIVADEMYQRTFTVVSVDPEEFERLLSAERLRITVDGSIEVIEPVSNREADYTL
jgi:predicted aconitase with swiveling domain